MAYDDNEQRQQQRRPSPNYSNAPLNPRVQNNQPNSRQDYFAQRRAQRKASRVTIWPRSPSPEPARRSRSPSSDREDSRRSKKQSKHSEKSSRRRRSISDSDSDSNSGRRRSSYKNKSKSRRSRHSKEEGRDRGQSSGSIPSTSRHANIPDATADADEWEEKADTPKPRIQEAALTKQANPPKKVETSDDEEIGPMPAPAPAPFKGDARAYGDQMNRGEGTAMAAFVAEGKRIPRRGEVGIEAEEIDALESLGYVMSGSRNNKMNAVRIRKENQVITAEEKRGLLNLQKEEKIKREQAIISSFRELVADKLQASSKPTARS